MSTRFSFRIFLSLLILSWVNFVCASESNPNQIDYLLNMSLEELQEVNVYIATQSKQTQAQAPAVTSVINSDEILAIGAQTLEDVLDTVPGIYVSRNGYNYSPRYFFRGVVSQFNPQALFLINGVPMTSVVSGDRGQKLPRQYSMSIKAIERIEIIRGPGSALYGADAFAGVINVITKGVKDLNGSELSIASGSFDTQRAALNVPFQLQGLSGVALLSYQNTDGDKNSIIQADVQSGIDELGLGPPASLAPGPSSDQLELFESRFELNWKNFTLHAAILDVSEQGRGPGAADSIDPGYYARRDANFDLSWHKQQILPDLDMNARIAYFKRFGSSEDTATSLFPAGAFFGAFPQGVLNYQTQREQAALLDLQTFFHGFKDHEFLFGAGFHWKDLYKVTSEINFELVDGSFIPTPLRDVSDTDEVFIPEKQRSSYYFMLQDEWRFAEDWTLTSGLRFDDFDDFGNATTPRVALVWRTASTFTSKLMYGEAFRAPSLTELYVTSNPNATGNPDLKPEKLRNIELAFMWNPTPKLNAAFNLYQYRIRDEIRYTPAPGGITLAENVGRVDGNGFEFELRHKYSSTLQFIGNYSYQETKDKVNGGTSGWAPKESGYARMGWDVGAIKFSPQIRYVGTRHREIFDPRENLSGYTAFDLIARFEPTGTCSVAFIGRNVMNEDTRDASRGPNDSGSGRPRIYDDDPQPGRSLTIEFNLTL